MIDNGINELLDYPMSTEEAARLVDKAIARQSWLLALAIGLVLIIALASYASASPCGCRHRHHYYYQGYNRQDIYRYGAPEGGGYRGGHYGGHYGGRYHDNTYYGNVTGVPRFFVDPKLSTNEGRGELGD